MFSKKLRSVARRRGRAPLLGLLLGAALAAGGCTLLENPDDHFAASDTQGDTGSDVVSSELCNEYCSRFLELCSTDPANTYTDEADCLSKCATLPLGEPTDYARNSVRCRMNHFGAAISAPADHCPHASFSGGGQCEGTSVSPCEAYCGLLSEKCPQTFAELEVPGGLSATATCVKQCGMFLPSPGGAGNEIFVSSSIECRESWLNRMSAPNQPGLYCQAATSSADGVRACQGAIATATNQCEALCLLALNECPGTLPFADFDACLEGCGSETPEAIGCAIDLIVAGSTPACSALSPLANACGAAPTCEPDRVCGPGCGANVAAAQCACGPGISTCDEDGHVLCFHDTTGARVVQRGQLSEICDNNLDDDCDGLIDAEDPDCTSCVDGSRCGAGCPASVPAAQCACQFGESVCTDGVPTACRDFAGSDIVFPFTNAEICGNEIDDNCDGRIDEADCIAP